MCSKMVVLPLDISHTRHRLKTICLMFTLMVYNVIHGVVDISTPYADTFESIMLHMIMARQFGLLMTLPHLVQGIYIVHALL